MTDSNTSLLSVTDQDRGSLDVAEGTCTVLLGPSGGGKTQWVRALLGFSETMDRVEFRGHQVDSVVLRSHLGWVPDGDGVFLDLSVWSNVATVPHLAPIEAGEAMNALDIVGLSHMAARPVSALTRTERRRVCLARSIARRCPLLIVDSDLDPTLSALLMPLLNQAPGLSGMLFMSSAASRLAWESDSVALMSEGRILTQAPWAELVCSEQPDVRAVVLCVAS